MASLRSGYARAYDGHGAYDPHPEEAAPLGAAVSKPHPEEAAPLGAAVSKPHPQEARSAVSKDGHGH